MSTRIDPTPEVPEPNPPCGGTWYRDPDGGIIPGDEQTALAAGLEWIATPAKTAKKGA